MFFYKFFTVFLLFFFSISLLGMDFTEDGGMNFDTEEVEQAPKKKEKKKKKDKKEENNEGMNFGDDTDGGGMNFGEEATADKNADNNQDESQGMNFGDEEGGMVFTDEDVQEEGAIKQEEMNFDLADIEEADAKKKKEIKKEDKVEIKKKVKSYVVKGFYFRLSSGSTYMLSPKIANGRELDEKAMFGFNTHLTLGYDIDEKLSAELYSEFIYNNAQIKGESNILYSRDLNSRTIGLGVNFNVMNNERTNLHLNAHAGILLIDSSLDMDGIKISGGALIGFEYYMLLKHFSSSIFLSGDYMTGYDTVSISLGASLKYSF